MDKKCVKKSEKTEKISYFAVIFYSISQFLYFEFNDVISCGKKKGKNE